MFIILEKKDPFELSAASTAALQANLLPAAIVPNFYQLFLWLSFSQLLLVSFFPQMKLIGWLNTHRIIHFGVCLGFNALAAVQ